MYVDFVWLFANCGVLCGRNPQSCIDFFFPDCGSAMTAYQQNIHGSMGYAPHGHDPWAASGPMQIPGEPKAGSGPGPKAAGPPHPPPLPKHLF